MPNTDELQIEIMQWGREALPDNEMAVGRRVSKHCEEIGELAEAIMSGDRCAILDELGDAGRTLFLLAGSLGVSLECAILGKLKKDGGRYGEGKRDEDSCQLGEQGAGIRQGHS